MSKLIVRGPLVVRKPPAVNIRYIMYPKGTYTSPVKDYDHYYVTDEKIFLIKFKFKTCAYRSVDGVSFGDKLAKMIKLDSWYGHGEDVVWVRAENVIDFEP